MTNFMQFLSDNRIPFQERIPLSKKSWIKTGGVCNIWVAPESISQLEMVCKYLFVNRLNFDLVGQTSNIFFHSTYNPQIIVSTVKANKFRIEDDMLTCDCGCNVMRMAKEMLAKGYAGFYGLVELPGTVAAAVVNNAGCFNCSISDMLISAEVLMPDGTITTVAKEDFGYEKRSSKFKKGEVKGVVLSVKLKLKKAENVEEEYRKSEETKLYRKTNQEGPAKNLGSVFAQMRLKYNYKNRLATIISNIAGKFGVADKKRMNKRVLLWLYGYSDLNPYISDKKLNTFVWCDDYAEEKFFRYKEFMNRAFTDLKIEIEERF